MTRLDDMTLKFQISPKEFWVPIGPYWIFDNLSDQRDKNPKSFAKLTGKHLYHSLFFKKDTLPQVFSSEFSQIFKNTSSGCFWKEQKMILK